MAKSAQTPALAANPLASTSSSAPPQSGTTGSPTQASSSVSPPVPSQPPNAAPNTQSSSPTSNIPTSSPTSSPQPPPPQTAIVPPDPAIAPVQVSKKTEWTTVVGTITTVVLTAAALDAAYVMIPHALETQRHEFHARCLADYDHAIPMAKGCPKELNGPRLSFVKRQIKTAYVVRFAAAEGIRFAKMKYEDSFYLRFDCNWAIDMTISVMAYFSINSLISIVNTGFLYSAEVTAFLSIFIPALFCALQFRFMVNATKNPEILNTEH